MPSRTMSVFGPELEPSRNFLEVRATEAAEVPAGYNGGIGLVRHGGSRPREAPGVQPAVTGEGRGAGSALGQPGQLDCRNSAPA
jgi:hypothetical protein